MRCRLSVLMLSKPTDRGSMKCLFKENASSIPIKRLLTRWSLKSYKILKLHARSSQASIHSSKRGERTRSHHRDPLSCLRLRLIIHWWALAPITTSGKQWRLLVLCPIWSGRVTMRHQHLKKLGALLLIHQGKITMRHRPHKQPLIRWN
jgi:hypothetical protein